MFKTSVSAIKQFWACPTRWHIANVYPKRVPLSHSIALDSGTAWHHFLEALLSGTARDEALIALVAELDALMHAALDAGLSKRAEDIVKDAEKLVAAGKLWDHWIEGETIAIEQPLKLLIEKDFFDKGLPCQDIEIDGKPDTIRRLKHNGRLVELQHKTIGGTKPIQPYLDTFHRQPHTGAYWAMILKEYKEEPWGVVLNLMRKLSVKTIEANPQAALQQHPIPISLEQSMKTLSNLARSCNAMIACIASPQTLMYENPDRDLGMFGNSMDQYVQYLENLDPEVIMNDDLFKDAEERYAIEEEVEA